MNANIEAITAQRDALFETTKRLGTELEELKTRFSDVLLACTTDTVDSRTIVDLLTAPRSPSR